ncbi:hypothetical protein A9958_13305 (plasmid) [Staphylococcus simulans]|uniref:sporulation delaying protein family toxin n=1 Tax=Staphylococcus simulans TaxID=1286 RepID=UPI000D0A4A6E|nr:sporulation delaying protein family toxin [Staphylococcus simulans]AVO03407.1 hypothetical protein BI282_13300 [Staphylococcus simulans]AVO06330.1 hypothetical protein BI283_13080 [Staphylococcus simulans]AWG19955.1 hypothetical protein A9958_13305 [Staphylococcus simulans]AWI02839.1 hypothetical protein A7X73_12840 [Staphylococcus simulans]
MKKVFTNLVTATVVLSSITPVIGEVAHGESTQISQKDNTNEKYTGKELFRGYVFAQGEVGEKLDDQFKSSMVKRLNDKDAVQVIDQTMQQMEKEDPKYFSDLQTAVYNKNPEKVDTLVTQGGQSAEKILNSKNGEATQKQVEDRGNWAYKDNYVALETVAAGAVAAVVVAVVSQIDATPVAAQDGTNKEEHVSNLIEKANQ